MNKVYKDRKEAGHYLATVIKEEGVPDIVYGVARGGVAVAKTIAAELKIPLGAIVVKKLGLPFSPELAFGAVAPGILVLDHPFLNRIGLSSYEIQSVREGQEQQLQAQLELYNIGELDVKGKNVLIVDDGVATGASALAAIRYIKAGEPKEVTFAAPVCAPETSDRVAHESNLICLRSPEDFLAVGQFYQEFEPITDEEVISLLKEG